MKKSLTFVTLAIVLLSVQACGTKSEKESEAVVVAETPAVQVLTNEQKREKLEKEIAAWEEKRRNALTELYKLNPTYVDPSGKVIYIMTEVEPSFDGGKEAMMNYLKDNLSYPQEAQEKEQEGTVFVDFIVEQNGTVREAIVTDDTHVDVAQSFRDEAIRVVNAMPKWVPGRQNGKAVDVKFSLPITFRIQ
jgi:TonB family protein